MEQAVGKLGRRADAHSALVGATQIEAQRGIPLIDLAKRIAILVGSWAPTQGITAVRPQGRAKHVHAELLASVVIGHHLALVLRMFRTDANAPLDVGAIRRLSLGGGTCSPNSCTSDVVATRLIDLGHLAEVVVEGVLSEGVPRRQDLGKSGSRDQKTAGSRHPFHHLLFVDRLADTDSRRTPRMPSEGPLSVRSCRGRAAT
jgi:hypothetical protein